MIVRVFRASRSFLQKVADWIFRIRAKYGAWLAGGEITWGDGISLAMPVRIDGKGKVCLGRSCSFGYRLAPRLGSGEILIQARDSDAVVVIGQKCSFSNNISIIARTRVELGDDCLVGDGVTIFDSDFHVADPDRRIKMGGAGETEPVRVGNNCWIGTGAMILKGVEIGDGSVIAPKSVVTKSFPARSVVAGIPAQLINKF